MRAVGAMVALAAAVAVVAGVADAAGSGAAVAYQIDAAHDGVQVDATLAPPFSRRWQVSLPGVTSYPLIAQGLVFVTAADYVNGGSILFALDQASGQTVWSQSIAFRDSFAGIAYDAGRVFVVGNDPSFNNGLMNAYDASTGALLWVAQLPRQYVFSAPPTAANGVVYTSGAGSGGTLYAVDESTGSVLATQSVENGDQSSPALSESGVFVSYVCNQDYGFAQTTLAPLWHYSTFCEGGGGATPAYAGGRVYTRDIFDNLILDTATGQPLGSFAPSRSAVSPVAVDGNTLWAVINSSLTGEDVSVPSAPRTVWTFGGDGQLFTAPIAISTATGEFLIEGSNSGMLYALTAQTGALVWSTNVGATIEGGNQVSAGQGQMVVTAGSAVSDYVSVPNPNCNLSNYPVIKGALNLKNANLAGCYLPAANLSGANATNANMSGTSLPSANLAGANLSQANLSGAFLTNTNLSNANLTGANLSRAKMSGATLTGVKWSQTTCPDETTSNADGGTCIGHT